MKKCLLLASALTLAGLTTRPVGAATIITDAAGVVFAIGGSAGALCDLGSPCALGPASASVTSILLPGSDPDTDPYSGSAAATIGGAPAPGLIASASATAEQQDPDVTPASPITFTAAAGLIYYFELTQTGGSYSGAVPVTMTGSSKIETELLDEDDKTTGSVSVGVTTADGMTTLFTLPPANNAGFSPVLDIMPGVLYEVQLGATVSAEVAASDLSSPSLSITASIDPTLTIDPTYAGDFSLALSNGIGNTSSSTATPEPGSLALAAVGALILIFRKRPKTSIPS